MTTKTLRAGGEVDSWCTKCQLLLNHRIVAMDKGKPVKVECLTCRTVHMFRAHAPGQKPAAGASKTASGAASKSATGGTKASRISSAAKAEQAEKDRTKSWEKAIAGRGVNEFRDYKTSEQFQEGELVRHSRFGDGMVVRVMDVRKIEVLFKDDTKTLAQNMTD